MRLSLAFLSLLVLLTWSCGEAEKPELVVDDIVKAAPEHVELLLDNDSVSVMRVTLPPKAQLPLHRGRDRVVYSLSDYKLRYRTQVGDPTIRDFRTGAVHWHSAGVHALQNVGPIPARFLIVSRKGQNPTPGVTSNAAELAPDKAKVVFENQDCKVIEFTLKPKEKLPPHNAASRVVYALTAGKIKYTQAGKSSEEEWSEGAVHWHEGGMHQVENISPDTIRFLVVEMM